MRRPAFALLRPWFVVMMLPLAAAAQAQPEVAPTRPGSGEFYILTTRDGAALDAGTVVQNFPVLVRLHREFFPFDQAGPDGSGLRFQLRDGTRLAHQVDSWDSKRGTAAVWVRIPRIEGDAKLPVRLSWGQPQGEQNLRVFRKSDGFAAVWHLDETLRDSGPGALHGTDHGTTAAEGIIGAGRAFGGRGHVSCGLEVASLPAGDAPRSMSAWVRAQSFADGPTIAGWGKQGAQHLSYLTLSRQGRVKFHGYAADPEGRDKTKLGSWHHVLVALGDGKIRFYLDGTLDHGTAIRKLDTLSPSAVHLGKHTPAGGPWARFFRGALDEVRFAHVARGPAWAKLCFENQRPGQRLVGPLLRPGTALRIEPASLELREGATQELTARADGALRIDWILRRNGSTSILATDRLRHRFRAPRIVADERCTLELRAVYPTGVRSTSVPIQLREAVPDPAIVLTAPPSWDGRSQLILQPQCTNQAVLNAAGTPPLRFSWQLRGPAVDHRIERADAARLRLRRSLGSGVLEAEVTGDNGHTKISRRVRITIQPPSKESWVARAPAETERPVDHQFVPRDAGGRGTIYYRGRADGPVDQVVMEIFTGEKRIARSHQRPKSDGRYELAGQLASGLTRYRTVLSTVRDGKRTELHTAKDLVCGEVLVIQGQSNAEAYDRGKTAHPHTSPWIRSFGYVGRDPQRARSTVWGEAVGYAQDGKLQIGYWGMELAKQLVAAHKTPICVVNGALGGTRIDQHQRPDAAPDDPDTIYGRLLWRLRRARLTHGVRAIAWHQGENDQGAAGNAGKFGFEDYRGNFAKLNGAWHRDLPNLRHVYVFQIVPRACAMGRDGSDDRLRDEQRRLAEGFDAVHLLSTVGIRPYGGCHYSSEGYAQFAERLRPLVARDLFDQPPSATITPPQLMDAGWVASSPPVLKLRFDQPVVWRPELASLFEIGTLRDAVQSGSAAGNTLTLRLKGRVPGNRLTYLVGDRWNRRNPVLRGANGIAALTFCAVPLTLPTLSPRQRNRRGDALLKAGRFVEAIADFDAYLATRPQDEPYHWQRGIAYYYAGEFARGVRQFEIHRTVNPDDVENAVWHFLCKARQDGFAAARKALLPVGPDARLPLATVYRLFQGTATPADVEQAIARAPRPQTRSARFYGQLYLGLYFEALGVPDAAQRHLDRAATPDQPQSYMGDIAKMHALRLRDM